MGLRMKGSAIFMAASPRWNVDGRKWENNRDWLHLCEHDQSGRIVGMNDIARVDQANAEQGPVRFILIKKGYIPGYGIRDTLHL
jgi:hypothetical protein